MHFFVQLKAEGGAVLAKECATNANKKRKIVYNYPLRIVRIINDCDIIIKGESL